VIAGSAAPLATLHKLDRTEMKIDIHNHGVPESVLEFFAAEPRFGIEITGEKHMSGGAEGEYELEPEFSDADAKVANLESHGLDGAVVSVDPPFFYYEVDAGAAAALGEVVNDGLREMAARRPGRLWWMATVPLQDPVLAAEVLAEQRRRGCVGVEIGTSTGSARLDEPHFEPFWAAASDLGVPVMIHPAYQHPHPGYNRFSLQNLIGNMYETTIAIERLIMAGVLDRHPGLTVVIVHSGGYFAFQQGRLRHGRKMRTSSFPSEAPTDPLEYVGRVRFDCLTHDRKALAFLIDQVGAPNMLMGTDLPCDMATPDPWDALVAASDEQTAARIAGDNVVELFGLEAWTPAAA
jgi:aminocarboxymuconate-semialdehyde decarboxylase